MSTSSGRTPLSWKSRMSWPQGTSGASAGLGPRPVSTRIVPPCEQMRKEPRLKRTLCSSVRSDSWPCQLSSGMVGKKLQRSNSSMPSDRDMISTLPTRMTLFGTAGAPLVGDPSKGGDRLESLARLLRLLPLGAFSSIIQEVPGLGAYPMNCQDAREHFSALLDA